MALANMCNIIINVICVIIFKNKLFLENGEIASYRHKSSVVVSPVIVTTQLSAHDGY